MALLSGTIATIGAASLQTPAGAATAVPGSPAITGVTPRGLGLLVSFNAADVSQGVTSYRLAATAVSGSGYTIPTGCQTPAPTTTGGSNTLAVVVGLCAGIPYTVAMTATNAAGTSLPSAPSAAVVPLPATAPGAPQITGIFGRDGRVIVTYVAPTDNGGKAITGYKLSAAAKGVTRTVAVAASATTAIVTGLRNGTSYALSLRATNALGASVAARATGIPKPPTRPGPPTEFSVSPGASGSLALRWRAPRDDGGAAIGSYVVTTRQVVKHVDGATHNVTWVPAPNAKPSTSTTSALHITLTGLKPTLFYESQVAAKNAKGIGSFTAYSGPATPNLRLRAGVVQLTTATLAALGSSSPGTLNWPAPAPAQVVALTVGQIIVGGVAPNAPQGVLARVAVVLHPTPGAYQVLTTPATLSDAFSSVSFASTTDLAGSSLSSFQPSTSGVAVMRPAAAGPAVTLTPPTLTLSLNIPDPTHLGLKIAGQVSLAPTITISGGIHTDWGFPDNAYFAASGKAQVSANLSVSVSRSWSIHQQLGVIPSPPIAIGPLVITPEIPIFLDVSVSGKIGFQVGTSFTVGASMSWNSDDASNMHLTNLSTSPKSTTPAGGVVASATGTLALEIHPEFLLYDVVGPGFSVTAGIKANVNANPAAGKPWLKVDLVVDIAGTLDLDLLIWHPKLTVSLASFSWNIISLTDKPAATFNITPSSALVVAGQSAQFSAARGGQAITPAWSLSGASVGDSISSGGLLRTSGPAYRSFSVVARLNDGSTATALVQVADSGGATSIQPPTNVSARRDLDQLGATVSWHAPAYTGGQAVKSFTITTSPATDVSTVGSSATSGHIGHLAAQRIYTIYVVANTVNGLVSPPATTVLGIDHSPSVSGPSPASGATISTTTPSLSVRSSDPEGDPLQFNYTVTGPSLSLISGWVGGAWTVPAHQLDPGQAYTWTAQARDPAGRVSGVLRSTFTVAHLPVAADLIATPDGNGYWQVDSTGKVSAFGNAGFFGDNPSTGVHVTNVIGMCRTPDGLGYWLVASDGGVFSYGDATFYGSKGGSHLNQPVVAMAPTRDGGGYWLVAGDSGIFSYGNAVFHGNQVDQPLNDPIVAMDATLDDGGYWLSASDGGVFAFGDATFYGSMGSNPLNYPVVDMSTTPTGKGYWLVAQDGGIFTFGDAQFLGSLVNRNLPGHIVSMERSVDGLGYWLNGCDGSVYPFGDAANFGSVSIYQCRGIYYNRIDSGWTKNPGDDFYSINGLYHAIMQGDGNFVIYGPSGATFATGTDNHPGARIVMQGDGNLVVYSGNTALWASHTNGHPGAHAELADNGHLIVYKDAKLYCDTNGTPRCG